MISLLLLKSIAFSQTDTSKAEKTFPISTVRLIMKDLISGDSAKAQLKLTEAEVKELEKKVVLKDSIITTLRIKETNYVGIIDSEKQKFQIVQDYSKKLEFDLKKEKVKNKFKSVVGTGIIVALSFFLITK